AAWRRPVAPRVAAYAGGALGGGLPLLAYNWGAFGSPFHLAYADVVGGLNKAGVFGGGTPRVSGAVNPLFPQPRLLRMAPVLAVAAAGVVILYREGHRAEASLIAAVAAVYLLYDSAYWDPFGGASPGPRFLIPLLPFLVLGLAPCYRRYPLTTGLL